MPPSLGWIVQPSVFEPPPGVDASGADLARSILSADETHVKLALDAGFDTLWVEDHMGWGETSHLECLTTLAWLIGRHPGPRYGTMVCGQAFRNPAYLAKASANLQLLTGGKFLLGLGAGNNPGEHAEFGFPFPAPRERIEQLAEAVRIARLLWEGGRHTYDGTYYSIHDAVVAPTPEPAIPIVIGGGGERRTLRLVAETADWWCADVEPLETFVRKSAVLDEHCRAVGRDPTSIVRSQVTWVSVEDDPSRLVRWPDLHIVAGDPDQVADELIGFRRAGVDHFQLRFMDYPSTAGLQRFIERVMPRLAEAWE